MSIRVKLWGVRGSLPFPLSPEEILERLRSLLEKYEKFQKKRLLELKPF